MRRAYKICTFLILIAVCSTIASFAIVPSSYMRVVLHEVRHANENNCYDMLIFGQSRGETNVNPYVLDDYLEYNSYNLSRRILCMSDMYYLASECNNNNQIKTIVLDVDHIYWGGRQISYYSDAYLLPHLESWTNRLDYFLRNTLNADYRVSFFRYVIHGTGDVKKIKERIDCKLSKEYRDFSMEAVSDKDVNYEYVGRGFHEGIGYGDKSKASGWDIEDIDMAVAADVKRLTDYCSANNIQLVAIHAPLPHGRLSSDDHNEMNDFFTKVFGEMGVEFIDFNYIKPEYLEWNDDDFCDSEGHMMRDLADRYSNTLGMVLRDYYDGKDITDYFSNTIN